MAEENQEFCLVCCDELSVVAIGSCDHQGTCAICSVRLRQVRQLASARQHRPATQVGRTRFMRKRQLQQDALKTNVDHGWAGDMRCKSKFTPSCMHSRDFPMFPFACWLMIWHSPSRNRPDSLLFSPRLSPYLDTDEDAGISCVGIFPWNSVRCPHQNGRFLPMMSFKRSPNAIFRAECCLILRHLSQHAHLSANHACRGIMRRADD
jgi:hypothetical protein